MMLEPCMLKPASGPCNGTGKGEESKTWAQKKGSFILKAHHSFNLASALTLSIKQANWLLRLFSCSCSCLRMCCISGSIFTSRGCSRLSLTCTARIPSLLQMKALPWPPLSLQAWTPLRPHPPQPACARQWPAEIHCQPPTSRRLWLLQALCPLPGGAAEGKVLLRQQLTPLTAEDAEKFLPWRHLPADSCWLMLTDVAGERIRDVGLLEKSSSKRGPSALTPLSASFICIPEAGLGWCRWIIWGFHGVCLAWQQFVGLNMQNNA